MFTPSRPLTRSSKKTPYEAPLTAKTPTSNRFVARSTPVATRSHTPSNVVEPISNEIIEKPSQPTLLLSSDTLTVSVIGQIPMGILRYVQAHEIGIFQHDE